jgi:hypothetical protein
METKETLKELAQRVASLSKEQVLEFSHEVLAIKGAKMKIVPLGGTLDGDGDTDGDIKDNPNNPNDI